jgi:hypothetical protein
MIATITGTRDGMKADQLIALDKLLAELKVKRINHGDCVGVDAEAHGLAKVQGIKTYVYPPLKDEFRARCQEPSFRALPNSYFARNREMVQDCDVVIAIPKLMQEMPKGGTWYTVRHARKLKVPTWIIWPNGEITAEVH